MTAEGPSGPRQPSYHCMKEDDDSATYGYSANSAYSATEEVAAFGNYSCSSFSMKSALQCINLLKFTLTV